MHSCVTQDKWEIKIERRDASAASILLYSSAAASVSLNRLAGELHLFLFFLFLFFFFLLNWRVCDLSFFSSFAPDCVSCALFSHLMEYIVLVDCSFLPFRSSILPSCPYSMNKNQVVRLVKAKRRMVVLMIHPGAKSLNSVMWVMSREVLWVRHIGAPTLRMCFTQCFLSGDETIAFHASQTATGGDAVL